MLLSVKQAFEGRDEKQDPLKMPAWEANFKHANQPWAFARHFLGEGGHLSFKESKFCLGVRHLSSCKLAYLRLLVRKEQASSKKSAQAAKRPSNTFLHFF